MVTFSHKIMYQKATFWIWLKSFSLKILVVEKKAPVSYEFVLILAYEKKNYFV